MNRQIFCPLFLALCIAPGAAGESPEIAIENAILKLIKEVAVPAEISGVLTGVDVREGDVVQQGQVLARVDDNKLRIEEKRARIDLKTAQVEHANTLASKDAELAAAVAKNELERVLAANKRTPNTYLESEVERFQLVADRSQLQVQQSEHDRNLRKLEELLAENRLALATDALRRCEVTAPWDGLIVAVDGQSGKWVEAGSEIVRMVDTSRLRIEGFVSSEHTVEELMGREAEVLLRRSGSDREMSAGRVVFVSPEINPVNSQARAFIEVENPDGRLRPGWKVEAKIRLKRPAAESGLE